MDIDDNLSCPCGKIFLRSSAAANHRRSCAKTKSRVSSLLETARAVWANRRAKKAKLTETSEETHPASGQAVDATSTPRKPPPPDSLCDMSSDLSVAQGRPTRTKRTPERYRNYDRHSDVPSPASSISSESPSIAVMDVDEEPESSAMNVDSGEDNLLDDGGSHDFACPTLNRFRLFRKFLGPLSTVSDPEVEELGFVSEKGTCLNRHEQHSTTLSTQPHESPHTGNGGSLPTHKRDTGATASAAIDGSPLDFGPYPNMSSFLLGEWFWNGGTQKSQSDFNNLIRILKSQEFNIDDIQRTQWSSVNSKLGALDGCLTLSDEENAMAEPGWIRKEISIQVPFHSRQLVNGMDPGPKTFIAGEFCYRSLISLLRERLTGPGSHGFHFDPYEVYWSPREGEPLQRVYGELYNCPAFLEAHKELQKQPPKNDCNLPRVVAGLMFSSDETHLAQFEDTKLWPLYMAFGNDSKYRRCKPTENLYHHVAYFTKLPDTFKSFVSSHIGGKKVNPSLVTHCIRELLHAQWEVILDDEFLEAYRNGVVIMCFDGIQRRFFPRIFTYSADYKEKVILSGIRSLPAKCPCPRCLAMLQDFGDLGTEIDRTTRQEVRKVDAKYEEKILLARKNLYELNFAVDGDHVDGVLKEVSLAPTCNAFFSRLSSLNFDFFGMLVVDLMHEIESGNWKSLFIHILRILHCSDDHSLIHQVNSRYRDIPTFGGDTIRKFQRNVTEMKNLAARDWEDMLQCAIPVFDGLFPEPHNSNIVGLLHNLAYWHGMAKLRLHTDTTLDLLDSLTTKLGNSFRQFKRETCTAYKTKELPKEAEARYRKNTKTLSQKNDGGKGNATAASSDGKPHRHTKEFNLNTYKFHAFGDYVATIRRFGTTDSYSTEPGELEHRSSKDRYKRTSKKNYTVQMAQIERRQTRIRRIRSALNHSEAPQNVSGIFDSKSGYTISKSEDRPIYLFDFLNTNQGDPAINGFLSRLKKHLLPRARSVLKLPEQHQDVSIFFQNDRMFKHQTLRILYETYDLRKGEDVINPDTSHRDIMLLRKTTGESGSIPENLHPFIYARVLGIYHVNVICSDIAVDPTPQRLDFAWVRWFHHQPAQQGGCLDELTFPPLESESSTGFIDPSDILRDCHVIPLFSRGKRQAEPPEHRSDSFWYPKQKVRLQRKVQPLASPIVTKTKRVSKLSQLARDKDDWKAYHINPFADRDMLMRYHWGMAIGHLYCQELPSLKYTLASENGKEMETPVPIPTPAEDPQPSSGALNNNGMEPVLRGGHYELDDPEAELLGDDGSDLEQPGGCDREVWSRDVDERESESSNSDHEAIFD